MADKFSGMSTGISGPITSSKPVVPNDGADLPEFGRAIYIDGAGSVHVETIDGDVDTFDSLAVGIWHPMRVRKVFSTGTTATGIKVGW